MKNSKEDVNTKTKETPVNMILSVTYYLELQNTIWFLFFMWFYFQVKLLLFYDIQITNLTFVGRNTRFTVYRYRFV